MNSIGVSSADAVPSGPKQQMVVCVDRIATLWHDRKKIRPSSKRGILVPQDTKGRRLMRYNSSVQIAMFSLIASWLFLGSAIAQDYQEIADPSLNAIANLRIFPDGSQAVVYNPVLCKQVGTAVCGFYRMHERAHIVLNHAVEKVPWSISEPEADCWAAQKAPTSWVLAMYDYLMSPGAYSPESQGTSPQRAARLKSCAGLP